MIILCILLYLVAGFLTVWGIDKEIDLEPMEYPIIVIFWPIALAAYGLSKL